MRLFLSMVVIMVVCVSGVSAGPVLDEILNYMYLDQTTPIRAGIGDFTPDGGRILTRDEPIGQTFLTGPETAKIIRIRCKIEPDAGWQKGEGVKMVLWDSPEKKKALGRYTIWHGFRGYQFGQPEFEVKADVKPGTRYYFELSYVGNGDGKLSGVGIMNGREAYNEGQGYASGAEADFDVCFQTHVKRPMDRVGNLKKAFARFNLDLPQLAQVEQAVDREDFDTAVARLIEHFETRKEPVPFITEPKLPKDFDIASADLALNNYFQATETGKGYAGPDINWRGEPDFAPDGTIASSGWNTGVNRFGATNALSKGYMATGDDKYVKKLNDVLIDWYNDNPPPVVSGIGSARGDAVWADLNVAIRLGGGPIIYSRIYKSPAFTLDCRMAYLLSLADAADRVASTDSTGSSWWTVYYESLANIGQNFPEYSNASKWSQRALERWPHGPEHIKTRDGERK